MIPNIWHFGKNKTMETVKRLVAARGWEVGRDKLAENREFLGQLKYSLWYCNGGYVIIYLSKPIEQTISRVNHNVNCGLFMVMMYQCRFINCNKHTTLAEVLDNGGGYTCVVEEGIWEFSVPSSQICCKPEIALKKKCFKKYKCI